MSYQMPLFTNMERQFGDISCTQKPHQPMDQLWYCFIDVNTSENMGIDTKNNIPT